MGTQVRDALVTAMIKENGKYATIYELAERLKLNEQSVSGALADLLRRNAVARRMRQGSKSYEYTGGENIATAEKYIGQRILSRRRKPARVPANSDANVGLIVKFGGAAHSITLAEAQAIYDGLKLLFGK